jgi:hypothetical protein
MARIAAGAPKWVEANPKPEGSFSKAKGRKSKGEGRKIQDFFFRETSLFNGFAPNLGVKSFFSVFPRRWPSREAL